MAENIFRKRKLFISWIVSYIAMLLIPVVMSIIVYTQASETVKSEILQANQVLLENFQKVSDAKIADIQQISMNLSGNEKLESLYNASSNFSSDERLDVFKLSEHLAYIIQTNSELEDIYVYFKNTEMVLCPGSYQESKVFHDLRVPSNTISFDQWKDMVTSGSFRKILSIPKTAANKNSNRSIVLVQTVPIMPNTPKATIVVSMKGSNFLQEFDGNRWQAQGFVAILDKEKNILLSSGSLQVGEELRYQEFENGEPVYPTSLKGEKVVISHLGSKISTLRYVSIIPEHVFWEKANFVRNITLFGILIVCIIGGIAAYFLSKRNYSPVNRIIEKIAQLGGANFEGSSNEFSFIQDAIISTYHEKEKVSKEIQKHNRVLCDNFVLKLLKGSLDNESYIVENMEYYNLKFSNTSYLVLLFLIEDFDGLFEDGDVSNYQDKLGLVYFVTKNVVEELINERYQCYIVPIDNYMYAGIVNLDKISDMNTKQLFGDVISRAMDFLHGKFKISYSVSVSKLQDSFFGIAKAYKEALDAMEYRIVMGKQETIFYENLQKSQYHYQYSADMQHQLMNLIKSGEFDKSSDIVKEIFEENVTNNLLSIEMVRCLIFDFAATIMKLTDGPLDIEFLDRIRPVNRLMNCKTVQQMKAEILEILHSTCEYFQNKSSSGNWLQIAGEIKHYIDERYCDVDLSVSMIGEHFRMTPHYLSKIFKDLVGEGLHMYINKVRMDKAKKLLSIKDITINEIAEKVGYINTTTFIRTFKKIEGITPGKYRRDVAGVKN